ncbi:MAG TPA: hypothetical protein VFC93_13105 [Chloroflexota bacterium]|nr:hypothetical protein [Chloroflexota bacterium]
MALPRYHLLASAALGGLMWAATQQRRAAAAPLISGFLVDFDHLADYALTQLGVAEDKILLAAHGWEYVPLWWVADRLLGMRGGLVLGYVVHLSIDQLSNEKRSRLAYFVAYRAKQRFRADQLGPRDVKQRHQWRKASPIGLLKWL